MKTLEWMNFFLRQQREHNKRVFTISELSNVANASPAVTNVIVGRLVKRGVLERAARGLYGIPGAYTLDDLLPMIDSGAYVTGARVLFDQGLLLQAPTATLCFTDRRPFSLRRQTAAGLLIFRIVRPPIYAPPREGVRASVEQALCDLVWTTPDVTDLKMIYTFRNLDCLKSGALKRLAARYPSETREKINRLLSG